MGWIIDLIILLVLALCVFLGFKRGLTGSILKILSFVIAIVISFILFKPVSNFIVNNTLIDDKIEESILKIVQEKSDEEGKVDEEETNLPQSMVNHINKSVENAANDTKKTIIENTSKDITMAIVNTGSAIFVFIIARIILIFVKHIANFITELPIIKQVDKLGGVIYGALEGLLIVFVIFACISFISPLIEDTGLIVAINKSVVASFMYNNNLLLKIIL